MGHSQVGTEHLLLGLIAEETGAAGRAFAQLGVTLDAARDAVMALVRPGEPTPPDQPIPFSPRAKGTLEASLRQAMGFKDTFIDTEHILLALLIERDGRTASVFASLACPPDLLRTTVIELRAASADARPARRRRGAARAGGGLRGRGTGAGGARRHALTPCARRSSGHGPARNPLRAIRYLTDAASPAPRAAVARDAARRRRGRGVVRHGGRGAAGARRLPHHAPDPHARAVRPARGRPREPRLPGRRDPAARAADRVGGLGARPRRLRLPRRPLGRARRGHRHPLRARARPPHAGDLARQGPRAAARDRPDGAAGREPRRRARRVRRRSRARARDGHRGRRPRRRVHRRAAGPVDRRRLHPRRGGLRALERPDRRRARGRGQERRRARRGRHAGPGPQRRGRRRRPHLPRGLALRRAAGRTPGVDDRAGRHRRPRRDRAGAAEPQPPGGRAARRRGRPPPRSRPASGRPWRRSTSCRCSPMRSNAPRSRRR